MFPHFYGALAATWLAIGVTADTSAQANGPLIYERREVIPAFEIDHQPTRIHTQGLYVTDDAYYVTGRLEREPKRPLLLRIDRFTRRQVEFIDLAANLKTSNGNSDALDHPSGFDFDGRHFWIALSASRPGSRSMILRVPYLPDQPLTNTAGEPVFKVNDHIGSLAFDLSSNRLYGANWDTRCIYLWEADGRLIRRESQTDSNRAAVDWLPAVQDWKSVGPGLVLAGGLDKRPDHDPTAARSVLEIWDLDPLQRIRSIPVPTPPGTIGEVAKEGCALWRDRVYFLPDDLGPGATIRIFFWPKLPPGN